MAKTAKKKTAKPRRPAKKKTAARKPNAAFMKPVTPSADLAEVIGAKPVPRTEVTKKLWAYIKKNGLQDAEEPPHDQGGRGAEAGVRRQGSGQHVRDDQACRQAPEVVRALEEVATLRAGNPGRPKCGDVRTGAAAPLPSLSIERRTDRTRATTLRRQHDLADVRSALDEAVRVCGALERKRAGDHRRRAGRRQLADQHRHQRRELAPLVPQVADVQARRRRGCG